MTGREKVTYPKWDLPFPREYQTQEKVYLTRTISKWAGLLGLPALEAAGVQVTWTRDNWPLHTRYTVKSTGNTFVEARPTWHYGDRETTKYIGVSEGQAPPTAGETQAIVHAVKFYFGYDAFLVHSRRARTKWLRHAKQDKALVAKRLAAKQAATQEAIDRMDDVRLVGDAFAHVASGEIDQRDVSTVEVQVARLAGALSRLRPYLKHNKSRQETK